MGSGLGVPDEKLLALDDWAASPLFDETERLALAYADAISFTDRDVDEDLFARVRAAFNDGALVELTATIAWENASSTFNRTLRVASQGLWTRVNAGDEHEPGGAVPGTAVPTGFADRSRGRRRVAVGILTSVSSCCTRVARSS